VLELAHIPQHLIPGFSLDICQCRVEYEYKANQADELNISPGDVIYVYVQQEDGWWQGDLNGTMGIFPASYVTVL
jgi:hypothetical protein